MVHKYTIGSYWSVSIRNSPVTNALLMAYWVRVLKNSK